MPWKCYMVELRNGVDFFHEGKLVPFVDLAPGAMWDEDGELCVKLPSGGEWNIDRGRNYNAQQDRKGKAPLPAWTRTGNAPIVTANPSINHVGKYHGWLRDGVLTDDCEGRKL